MSTRSIRRPFVTAGLVGCALLLSACASAIAGHGSGTAQPGPTFTQPAPSSSSAPSSAAPSSPSAPAPVRGLSRRPGDTAIGDPAADDMCSTLGTSFLRSFGGVIFGQTRYSAGCVVRVTPQNDPSTTKFGVVMYAYAPGTQQDTKGGKNSTVRGYRVYSVPLDNGNCLRQVFATGVVFEITTYATQEPATSPRLCQAAGLAVSRVVGLLAAHTPFKKVPRAANSVYDLDLCKVADRAKVTSTKILTGAKQSAFLYGTECYYDLTSLYAYFDIATYQPATNLAADTTIVRAGTHVLYAEKSNSDQECIFESKQGTLSDNSGVEAFVFQFSSRKTKGPAGFCNSALPAVADFLDAAGRS